MSATLHWREHARSSSTVCGANSAFATFVSGDKYVPGAVCLRRSLHAAGSHCPMDLIYDDRSPEHNLSAPALSLLATAYGEDRLFSLARLMSDHPTSMADMEYAMPPSKRLRRAPAKGGRRLFERGREHMATHAKLWFWSLPRARSVLLDSDMVVRGSLDWLTTFALDEREVGAAAVVRPKGRTFFNSGVMVIQPNARRLHNLTAIARSARSGTVLDDQGEKQNVTAPIGEKLFGDQSLLNLYFRRRWRPLPQSTMVAAPSRINVDPVRVLAADPAVVHFLSEPKPWLRSALRIDPSTRQPVGGLSKLSGQAKLWWELCADKVGEVPARALGR